MKPNSHYNSTGFTLIELLISLTLGLMLTASFGSVLISNKQTFRSMDASSRVQETGRYAMHLLTRDLRNAGFVGCGGLATNVTNTLNAGTEQDFFNGPPIEGFEHKIAASSAASAWSPTLDSSITGAKADSDVVMLRTVTASGIFLTASMPTTSADLPITPNSTLATGDILMISDCGSSAGSAAIFQATQLNGVGGSNLVHNTGAGAGLPSPGNSTKDLGQSFGSDAEVMKLENHAWYIGIGASGEPALFLESNDDGGTEMVEGVESLQVLVGEDTNNNGAANRYLTADLVSVWNNVVSVRISIIARTSSDNVSSSYQTYTVNGVDITATDHRIRRVFTSTVNLRNVSAAAS